MKILYVEDNAQDADLTKRALGKVAAHHHLTLATSLAEARGFLAGPISYDLLLLDLSLPDGSGIELLAEVRSRNLPLAVLILTGTGDEETAVSALKAGADDYLVKRASYLDRLPLALETALNRRHSDVSRSNRPLRVLYVEHHIVDIDLTRRHLRRFTPHIVLEVCGRAEELLARLPSGPEEVCPWDVLLLDYRLPGHSALDILKSVRDERRLDIPIVLVTGQGDEEIAILAFRLGATDYLVKHQGYLFELPGVLENAFQRVRIQREQNALRESEARFRRLAENAQDVIYRLRVADEPGFDYISPAVTALTGYTPEEFYADPTLPLRLLHPDDRQSGTTHFRADNFDQPVPALRWICKDGRVIWSEQRNVPVYNDEGKLIAVEGIARDVTAAKRIEEDRSRLLTELHSQAQRTQQLMHTVPQGLLLLREDGAVVLTNPAADRVLPVLADFQAENVLARLGETAISDLLIFASVKDYVEVSAGGRIFTIRSHPVQTEPDDGHWVVLINEVTEERERIRYQQAQERLATVGQMAAGIAHDFNNIMGVIVLYVQMLRLLPDLSERSQRQLTQIHDQAQHAANLINQILDFSRRSVMEFGPVDVLPLIKELTKLLERTFPENVALELVYDRNEYLLQADPTRLQQVLMNLALNARDAMPSGGVLHFELLALRLEMLHTTPLPDMEPGDWLHIQVRDSGIGIPPENLSRIFDPFFTTKGPEKGTGLGLAQVYGIVKQHSGSIGVQSKVGQGTTFNLYLPLIATSPAQPTAPTQTDALSGGHEVILLVEDNKAMRESVADVLGDLGYEIVVAENGEEAISRLEQMHRPVSLVLSDLVMPGMSGLELFAQLRHSYPGIRCLLMTGHLPESAAAAGFGEGAPIDWLQKPFSIPVLADRIRQILAAGN